MRLLRKNELCQYSTAQVTLVTCMYSKYFKYWTTENKKIYNQKRHENSKTKKRKKEITCKICIPKTAYYFMSPFLLEIFFGLSSFKNIDLQIRLPKISCCPPSQKQTNKHIILVPIQKKKTYSTSKPQTNKAALFMMPNLIVNY